MHAQAGKIAREATDAIGRFDLAAVVSHIVLTGFRVARDEVGRGRVRTVVETRGRNRHRKDVEAGGFQFFAGDDALLAAPR